MYFPSTPLVAAMVMAMLPSALATPVAAPSPNIILGTLATEAEALKFSAELGSNSTPSAIEEAGDGLSRRSYYDTCTDCNMSAITTFSCKCRNSAGQWAWTSLDLNRCLGNFNGKLQWAANGNYKATCGENAVYLSYTIFETYCRTSSSPNLYKTTITLEERVHNWNGVLGCQV